MQQLIVIAVLFAYVSAAPESDQVKSLPGLKTPPKWNHYSGYLQASGVKQLHYW